MSAEEMKKLQSEKLVKQVKHVYENVPYYRNLMDEKGVTPEDIKGIEDLHKLPFLQKSDLRDAYNSIAKSIIGIGIIALGAAKADCIVHEGGNWLSAQTHLQVSSSEPCSDTYWM